MSCHDNSNKSNGMMTKIWGPHGWIYLHTITFGYPLNPTPEDKENYKTFFIKVGDTLPCGYCRESYKQYIKEGKTALTDETMESRENLTRWLYEIHEAVNRKLGMSYGITYEHVANRYESYRAQCVSSTKRCEVPEKKRAISFRIANSRDCPIIPVKYARIFRNYAIERNLNPTEFYVIEDPDPRNNEDIWNQRNRECCSIIDGMREEGIPSLERDGPHAGLPTVEETRLILRLSSTMPIDEVKKIARQIKKSKQKRYMLVNITN